MAHFLPTLQPSLTSGAAATAHDSRRPGTETTNYVDQKMCAASARGGTPCLMSSPLIPHAQLVTAKTYSLC